MNPIAPISEPLVALSYLQEKPLSFLEPVPKESLPAQTWVSEPQKALSHLGKIVDVKV